MVHNLKILLVVSNFIPESSSAAHIYFDLAKAFIKKGHEVDIITSYPRKYNLDEKEINKKFPDEDIIEGITVHRCKHPATRDIIFLRGTEHFLLPLYYFKKYQKIGKKFDVCLMFIPPLPFFYLARKIKNFDGTRSVLNFQDFHPQELIEGGILKNKLIILILEYIEKKSYKNADYITVLSKGGINYVISKGGNPTKIEHIYNGFDLANMEDISQKIDFKKKEGIQDKILVSYAGILSPFQGIDNILNVAKKLIKYDDFIFYIIGDGMNKNHIENRVKKENLSNVRLLPFQPRDEYLNIITSSDISLVSLDIRMKAPCIPGKIMSLLATGQPIIGIVPTDSETANVIRKAKCGIVIEPGNVDEFVEAILKLGKEPKIGEEIGYNGRLFFEENMNLDKIVKMYEKIFENLINN